MGSVFLHLADLRSQFFDLFVGEFHTAESDAVSGKMMFIYKIIVVIELFLIYPLVFLNIRFGTAGLGTVGTILGTVTTAGIGKDVDSYPVSLIFVT